MEYKLFHGNIEYYVSSQGDLTQCHLSVFSEHRVKTYSPVNAFFISKKGTITGTYTLRADEYPPYKK